MTDSPPPAEAEAEVTLAYRWDGHEPDETVTVPAGVARRLVRDGTARWPDGTTTTITDPELDEHQDQEDGA